MPLNDKQVQLLKLSGYTENPSKPNLWSNGPNGKLRFLDFRHDDARAYWQQEGELVNDSNKLLSQIKVMIEGQTTLEGL